MSACIGHQVVAFYLEEYPSSNYSEVEEIEKTLTHTKLCCAITTKKKISLPKEKLRCAILYIITIVNGPRLEVLGPGERK